MLDVLGGLAASITVVTATSRGRYYGATVSAFSAVSLDPPLVLVCISDTSATLGAAVSSRAYTINFLAAGRSATALRFATRGVDKFAATASRPPTLPSAGPRLVDDAYACFECELVDRIHAGDHEVLLGAVANVEHLNNSEPLVYWNRAFACLGLETGPDRPGHLPAPRPWGPVSPMAVADSR